MHIISIHLDEFHFDYGIFFQDMKELFNRIDRNHSGNLDLQETILFFKSITDDISDENIESIFNTLDTDGNKVIDFEEFMVGKIFNV